MCVEEILYYSANIKFSNTTPVPINSNAAAMYKWEKERDLILILLKWSLRLDSYNISESGFLFMIFMDYGAEFPLTAMLKQKDLYSFLL